MAIWILARLFVDDSLLLNGIKCCRGRRPTTTRHEKSTRVEKPHYMAHRIPSIEVLSPKYNK